MMEADRSSGQFQSIDASHRFLIGISGIPGSGNFSFVNCSIELIHQNSGKTTLASLVTSRLNARSQPHNVAAFIPMDGYHLTRAQLAAMNNAEEAIRRRGAAFTFDGASFLELVKKLRQPLGAHTPTIYAPSFDHAVKDPVADDLVISATARIVVFEGNYLALNRSPWKEAGELMDVIWFVEVDEAVARARLAVRHVKAGIVDDYQKGLERADGSDLVNGREIVAGRVDVHETIISTDDNEWKGQE